jgi:diguanylate cyclase (GGDEF)-like protein
MVSPSPDASNASNASNANDSAERAARELVRVQVRIEAARSVLARLLQDVVVAESRLSNSQAAQLLEANEQLVVTALRNQSAADTAAQALTQVSRSAKRDALTQLPNRVLLLDRFAKAIDGAKRRGTRLALLFLDLDNFKQINDTLGHAVGDDVLRTVAHRLLANVREADTVSRHGGDEFLVLLADVAQPADAAHIAEKLVSAIGTPGRIGDHVLRLSVSMGISLYPDDGEDVALLVDRADMAMYQAKRRGLGQFAFYDAAAAGARRAELPPGAAAMNPLSRHELALAEHQRRHTLLREANEQLVLAALDARELQAAAERSQQRQAEFMRLAQQELGNPLAPIRQAMAMLGRGAEDDPLLPRARALIEEQVAHMTRLVAAVHEVAHAHAPLACPDRQRIDMADVIDAAVLARRPAMDTRLQTFTVQRPEGKLMVLGDAMRLQQTICNLLDNASKYTPDLGEVHLHVQVQGGSLVIAVSDNGIGIDADALPHLFEPFMQDTYAIGLHGVGLGIGLTVVRALAEAHGGSVSAHSAGRGLGSRFVVTLPLAAAEAAR